MGLHCYAVSTHPDELVLEPSPKKHPGSAYDNDIVLFRSLVTWTWKVGADLLKTLNTRATDFGGPQNFASKDYFQHFCCAFIFVFLFWFNARFFTMPLANISIEEWARKLKWMRMSILFLCGWELIMVTYNVWIQNAWIHFSDYTRPVSWVRYSIHMYNVSVII